MLEVKKWSLLVFLTEGQKVGVVACCPVHRLVTCREGGKYGEFMYAMIPTPTCAFQTTRQPWSKHSTYNDISI